MPRSFGRQLAGRSARGGYGVRSTLTQRRLLLPVRPRKATLYVSFKSWRSAAMTAGWFRRFKRPDGKIVHPYQWKASRVMRRNARSFRYYAVCLDNQFTATCQVGQPLHHDTRYDEWEKFFEMIYWLTWMSPFKIHSTLQQCGQENQVIRQSNSFTGASSPGFNPDPGEHDYVSTWSTVQERL